MDVLKKLKEKTEKYENEQRMYQENINNAAKKLMDALSPFNGIPTKTYSVTLNRFGCIVELRIAYEHAFSVECRHDGSYYVQGAPHGYSANFDQVIDAAIDYLVARGAKV